MKSTRPKEPSSSPEFGGEAAPIRIDRPQFIYRDGRRTFAVVPIEDWERIVNALDDLEDIFFLEQYRADREPELLPSEMVDALLSENPIRVWREHRGLTQRQLAELAGISTPYLSQLEAGKREASQRVISRLAKALRVDVDDLIRVEPKTDATVFGDRARPTEGADGDGAESTARLTRRRGARR